MRFTRYARRETGFYINRHNCCLAHEVPAVAKQAVEMTAPAGTVVMFSSIHPNTPVEVNMGIIHSFQKTITGAVSPPIKAYHQSKLMIEKGLIDPTIWYDTVICGLKELFSVIPAGMTEKINGIGITGQMHTTVFLDENGDSIRPAIMWNDNRSGSCVLELKEQICSCSKISYIADIISPGSTAANLYWLRLNEPGNFKHLKTFLIAPDYIVYRLTGKYSTDYCEASTSSLYDLYCDTWSDEMRELIGLPFDSYPPIKGSGKIVGNLLPSIAKKLDLPDNIKVIVGTGDNPATGIATGYLINRYPVLSIGTSGILMFIRNQIDFTKKGKNIRFSIDGNDIITLVQGAVQSAGNSLSWWMRDILESSDFDVDINIVESTFSIQKNLLFYPHLVGDKTIYGNPNLRGAFIGIGSDTTRVDMQIAIMEGICFAFRELMEAMEVERNKTITLKVTGGGSRSSFWMQMLANVLDVEIELLGDDAGACYGIALLAYSSCSNAPLELSLDPNSVQSLYKCIKPYNPNVKLYDQKYLKYKRIHSALNLINAEDIMEDEHENM